MTGGCRSLVTVTHTLTQAPLAARVRVHTSTHTHPQVVASHVPTHTHAHTHQCRAIAGPNKQTPTQPGHAYMAGYQNKSPSAHARERNGQYCLSLAMRRPQKTVCPVECHQTGPANPPCHALPVHITEQICMHCHCSTTSDTTLGGSYRPVIVNNPRGQLSGSHRRCQNGVRNTALVPSF